MKKKKFKISELFFVETGKDLIYSRLIDGNYNVIGHGVENNGVTCTTDKLENYKLYDPSKTIALANRGNFHASVQNKSFYVGTRVKALTAKFNSNIYILMYIATIINQEKFRYSYGRNACDKIEDIEIELPTKGNDPDYKYMETYILSIFDEDILKTNNKGNYYKLDSKTWKLFNVSDVFKCSTTKALDINLAIDGEIPYITRSAVNNGYSGKYGNSEYLVKGNCITIGAEGRYAFYQKENFISGVKVYTLRNKNMNKYNALFLTTLLNKKVEHYNYGRARVLEKIVSEKILLPVDSSENIDWIFMENYIKKMPFADKI